MTHPLYYVLPCLEIHGIGHISAADCPIAVFVCLFVCFGQNVVFYMDY